MLRVMLNPAIGFGCLPLPCTLPVPNAKGAPASFSRLCMHATFHRCEWDAFSDMIKSDPRLLERVDQLVLELHLRSQLQMPGMPSLASLMRHILVDHGFRVFSSRAHKGFRGALTHTQAPRDLTAAGFNTKKYMAVELSFMRPSPSS